ncbi:SbcC/MukB-like Walker B domain-containing protein, partial [Nocardia amamiensis]|uniref:SbcC/MukB-like Walker B domain-containing protein n=1 Tax=Nocardia amamiensis TaxID=404578 RepID=UPI000AB18012
ATRLAAAAGVQVGQVDDSASDVGGSVPATRMATTADEQAETATQSGDAAAVPAEPGDQDGVVRRAAPESGPRDDVALLTAYAKVVTAASRTPERQAEIDAELLAADRARAHAEAVLAEPEIQAAAASEPDDLAELDAQVAAAQSSLNAAVAAHAEAGRRASQLEELGGQLWAAVDRIAPAQQAFEELKGLADVVAGRGANNRHMSLHSYVLAARLEEVAQAGSLRLRKMSGGRYEFVHSDKAGPRGRRGGLGLDIRDDYTGAIRPAKTLSGGETFMASLSLALGLADTVAAESGGVVLDTLFIDEGFGGLDADSLDAVMGVLDELRAGGRVVGVVSHVDEMRQRIPSRLHVFRGRTGSRLQATIA